MKIFHFFRHEDHSGVSGTGTVAEGVEFSNGWCALRWLSNKSSFCFYQSLSEVKAIHGHGGKTEIVMSEIQTPERSNRKQVDDRFEILLRIIDEAGNMSAMLEDPDATRTQFQDAIKEVKMLLLDLESKLPAS